MSKSITQDMAYRQSLMKYAEKYGVSRASRKYNKSRSYIYFWKARWDGTIESLACQSRRPHHHPNQHTEEELKLIRDMRRAIPTWAWWGCGTGCGRRARACLKIGDVSSSEGFWAAGKQFFRRNPGGFQGKIAPSRGQKTR